MTRMTMFSSPLLLGFEEFERVFERLSKSTGDGYPPYNIEETGDRRLRITLAVAGFTAEDLSVTIEDRLLVIRGRQEDDPNRKFLHRGIAARQFQRTFLLADGVEVVGASLDDGLLHVDAARPEPGSEMRTIAIEKAGGGRPPRQLRAVGGNETKF